MNDADRLIHRYLDDLATDGELAELDRLLSNDPGAAEEFARVARTQGMLGEFFGQRRRMVGARQDDGARQECLAYRGRKRRRMNATWATVALAILAGLLVGQLTYREVTRRRQNQPMHEVVLGSILVDGTQRVRVGDGMDMEVAGDIPALLRLADGSHAELFPQTRAVVHTRAGSSRPLVELRRGRGDFQVAGGADLFRVNTPVGSVTGEATEFSVELCDEEEGGNAMWSRKLAMSLIVAVMAGKVDVQHDGERYALLVGENRIYAAEGQPKAGKPDLSASVVAVSENGKSITLEMRGKAPTDQAVRQEVRIDERTQVTYANVPAGEERPNAGYRASVWFQPGQREVAAAVRFEGKSAQSDADLFGKVTAVSNDGSRITLEVATKKGQDAPRSVELVIPADAKVAYAFVPDGTEKPSVGLHAAVWLKGGTSDQAATIKFAGAKKGGGEPGLAGRIASVAADGTEIVLELSAKKEGSPGTRTIKLTGETKISAADGSQTQPRAGLFAAVSLRKDSPDVAGGIVLAADLLGLKKDKGPTGSFGPFSIPKGIELAAEQRTAAAALARELQPRLDELKAQRDSVATDEQKKAGELAKNEATAAGLDKGNVKDAIDAAMNLSAEQKERLESLGRQDKDVQKQFRVELEKLLTEAQRAALQELTPSKPKK